MPALFRPLIQSSRAYLFQGGTVSGGMPAGSPAGVVRCPSLKAPTFSLLTANSGLAIDATTGQVTITATAPHAPSLLAAAFRAVDASGRAVEGLLVVTTLQPVYAAMHDILVEALDNHWNPGDPNYTTSAGGLVSGIKDQGNLKIDLTQPTAALEPAAVASAIATGHTALRPTVTAGQRSRLRNVAAGITRGCDFLGSGTTDGSMSVCVINGAYFTETPASTFPTGTSFVLGVVWDETTVTFYNGLTAVYSKPQAARTPGAIFAVLNIASSNGHNGRVLHARTAPIVSLGDQGDADGATVTTNYAFDGAIASVVRINGRVAL